MTVSDQAGNPPPRVPNGAAHPVGNVQGDTVQPDDSAIYIDQARWLINWHNQRSEAMNGRAVAILGFNGVIMALLLQGAGLNSIDPTVRTWTLLALSLAAVLGSALFALRTIGLKTVRVPPVQQLRQQWLEHRTIWNTGQAGRNVAEAFLNSQSLDQSSAVSDALQDADARAKSFRTCLWLMIASLVVIAALVLDVLSQSRGA